MIKARCKTWMDPMGRKGFIMDDKPDSGRMVDYSFIETRGLMRSRMRTVGMLVAISAAAFFMAGTVIEVAVQGPGNFLPFAVFSIVGMVLHYGFLRSVVLGEPEKGYIALLIGGWRFVFRVVPFYAAMAGVLFVPGVLLFIFTYLVLGLSEYAALKAVVFVLILKFCRILILTPLMIVFHNDKLSDALRRTDFIKYREIYHLIALFVLSWGIYALIPQAALQGNIALNAVVSLLLAITRVTVDLGGVRVLLYKRDNE